MARLHRCWVIVDGAQPTAFHAKEAEQLVPTLKQLQRTQPQVALMWFERGRMWPSPEAAQQALREQRGRRPAPNRGRDWRPGGEHRDPKARPEIPRDVRRARFKKRLIDSKTGRTSGRGPDSGSRDSRRTPDRETPPRGPRRPRPPREGGGGQGSSDRRPSGGPSTGRPPSGAPRDRKGPGSWQSGRSSSEGSSGGRARSDSQSKKAAPDGFGRKPERSRGGGGPKGSGQKQGGPPPHRTGRPAPNRKRSRH